MAAEPGVIARRHVQVRAQAAGIADARAVDMAVVERGADFGMVVHPEIGMAEGQQPPHLPLGEPRGDVLGMIGIGHVGASGRQQEDRRAVLALGRRPRRPDEEGEIVLARRPLVAFAAGDMQRIGAAAEIPGDRQRNGSLPARVVEVALVKVDGAVVLGLAGPAMFFARPNSSPSCHGPADGPAGHDARADIDGSRAGNLLAKSQRAMIAAPPGRSSA